MGTPSDLITEVRQLERRLKALESALSGIGTGAVGLPENAVGYLHNDGRGGLSWAVFQSLLSGLVSYWPLDESGDIQHDVVGTNHLSDASFNAIRPGKMGFAQGFEFEGPDVAIANPSGMASDKWTIAGWFLQMDASAYPRVLASTQISGDDGMIGVGGDVDLLVGCAGQVVVKVYDAEGMASEVASGSGVIALWRWHFIAVTKDGPSLSLQVDNGEPITGEVPGGGPAFTSFRLGVGWDAGVAASPGIDEIGFWSRALTAGEIAKLYNGGRGVTYPFAAPGLPSGYAGSRIVSDGAQLMATRSSETRMIFDDFETAGLSGQFGAQGWATTVASGGSATQIAGAQDAAGVLRLSATSAGASAAVYSGGASRNSRLFGGMRMILRARVRLNQVTNHSFRIGFQSAIGTNGAFFEFNTVSQHWMAKTADGGNVTSVDTAWPVQAQPGVWTMLEIDVSAEGEEAKFVVDGHPQATVNTNIPKAAGREFGIAAEVLYGAGSGGQVDVDWMELITFAPVFANGATV